MIKKIVSVIVYISLNAIVLVTCVAAQKRTELCYRLIETEESYGFKISSRVYSNLDNILQVAEKELGGLSYKNLTTHQARSVFRNISELLRAEGYTKQIRGMLFHEAMRDKKLECDSYSFLYYSICKRIGFDASIVVVPGHILVSWSDGAGSEILWETTTNTVVKRNTYINKLVIDEQSINEGVYLSCLSEEEIYGVIYNNIGVVLAKRGGRSDKILNAFANSGKLYPNAPELYYNKGTYEIDIGRADDGLANLKIAVELYPSYYDAIINIAATLSNSSKHSEALKYYNDAIKIRPLEPMGWASRGLEYFKMKEYKNAMDDFDRAIQCDSQYGRAFFYRAHLNHEIGNTIKACDDLKRSCEIGFSDGCNYYRNICK